jgi:hypothetical protein
MELFRRLDSLLKNQVVKSELPSISIRASSVGAVQCEALEVKKKKKKEKKKKKKGGEGGKNRI